MNEVRLRLTFATAIAAALLVMAAHPSHAVSIKADVVVVGPYTATVDHVIDGDTFTLTTGEKVRVLGIDSCEMNTQGGRDAKDEAEVWLTPGETVTLAAEPTRKDKDQYGRLLRYVTLSNGQDYGTMMIISPHTGLYKNGDPKVNDASQAYIDSLRPHISGPRNCAGFYNQPGTSAGGDGVDVNPDYHHDDHKSRFCRHHWFC